MTWHRNRQVVLGDRTTVSALAQQMEVSVSAVVRVALEKVGLLVVVTQVLTFDQASAIARHFGFTVRRQDP